MTTQARLIGCALLMVSATGLALDRDGDGLDDVWELQFFGGLSEQQGSGDADGDGLSNAQEFAAGTDPTNPDSDGDGLTDGAEVQATPATDPARADTDDDGVLSLDEFSAVGALKRLAERRPKSVERIFNRLDKDDDEGISAEEFTLHLRHKRHHCKPHKPH